MKPKLVSRVIALVLTLLSSALIHAQNFGTSASAIWIATCTQDDYLNTSGSIGTNSFSGTSLGTYTYNSGSLVFRGGEVRTTKSSTANVCGVKLYYRVYAQSATPGSFTAIDLPLSDNCDAATNQFPSGGACSLNDQKWNNLTFDGTIDLTTNPAGNYTIEVYYEITGSSVSNSQCDQTILLNNNGANYKASFSIQQPVIASTNPSTCNGSEGSITISGLTPGATYSLTYTDDGAPIGPLSLTANSSGQITVTGLNAGLYSDFLLSINGCSTNLSSGVILSNPVIIPKFNKITLCAGSTAPALPATSVNGITGTWSPATIDNQTSRSYTFTPNANQCAVTSSIFVTVTPRTTPTFSFGTSLIICNSGTVPTLPTTSANGITGTWNPSVVSSTASGTYTFTPASSQCANTTTFTVTVNPILTPAFSFGTAQTICAGSTAPSLPTTSTNGITGTWSPALIDNQASGTYTFTPASGQCAVATTLSVTVQPNATPIFSFGNALSICAGGTVPTLPSTSSNGITGTWSPAVVDNQASGTYTFTPSGGVCAIPVTFSVTVSPIVTPTFNFGTSLTICAGGTVPVLTGTSIEGITGSWTPSVADNQHSATYTFTPAAGQCASTTTFTITVTPNVTPSFSFGTALTICAGSSVPGLPASSTNGINGSWSPATIDNQASGTYTFTPTAGQCAVPVSLTVIVNPNTTPTFNFGTSLSVCAGATVPALPNTSSNGITGSWNPATVDNAASGVYTFTPTTGLCATPVTFTVTVSPNIVPIFSFGTSISICAGASVPMLPSTSSNGITGTWNPASVDNNASGTYTFSPTAGQCATTTTFTVTVSPNKTPSFSFGTSLTICTGGNVPALPSVSSNGINGTWNPSTVDNTASGIYTFTPAAGQCAVPATFTVTVNPNVTPTFSFGTSLAICQGTAVPTLATTSSNNITGTWSPSSIDNQASGTYTFTPAAGQCAVTTSLVVNVTPTVTPTFSFGNSLSICAGGIVPSLPSTSINGVSGTWNPAIVDNQASGTYTFTPASGICAIPVSFTVTVSPNVTPTFSFGTSLSLCSGSTAPALPASSVNGITGTWNPATIDNTTSGTYTFTPTGGQCAVSTTLAVAVSPVVTPTFAFGTSLSICAGGSVPSLPTTSSNGVNGTWSPATADNQQSGTYTFTPTGAPCAIPVTFTITITPNTTPVFSFGTSLSICAGASVLALPATSNNGVAGTWSPSVIDNGTSGTYTFTPASGQCALPVTLQVTVNSNVTPTFSFGTSLHICAGSIAPSLPTASTNGINGTWSPAAIDNQQSGTYIFTPAGGQCATPVTLTITIDPVTIPTFSFGSATTICAGSSIPALPTVSSNGITGSWNPAVIDNQNSGVYTFTPSAGQCASVATFTVTVNQPVTPTFSFGTSLNLCAGATAPTLPATSANGITGTWSPATLDNQNSGTYTFTPASGQCATATTLNVVVSPIVAPTFSFGSTLSLCAGSTAPSLSMVSNNGISGSWSPATIDNQASGTYIFTPSAGQCATGFTLTVTINPTTTPVFSFGTSMTACAGSAVPALPTTSNNGITGTWNPAVVNDQASGVYTFTPLSGQCATQVTFTVTINPIVTPAFSFGTNVSICAGATAPVLTTTSTNNITGTWSPATIDNQTSGTYTFTPDANQCATPLIINVTVNPVVAPVFAIGTTVSICQGTTVPTLDKVSTNGITGTWSPAVIDNQNSATYIFTPDAGQCATTVTLDVMVNPNTIPTFTFGKALTICAGSTVPDLIDTSSNGIVGKWSPALIDNQASGTYTFTPDPVAGQCLGTTTLVVTVNPTVTPVFNLKPAITLCSGSTAPALPSTATNGITGSWSPATIDNHVTGVYTFTPAANQCATGTVTLTVNITPIPVMGTIADTTVTDGASVPTHFLSGTPAGLNYTWSNSNAAIGLGASGTGDIPGFTAINKGGTATKGIVTITPVNQGCSGSPVSYTINVLPLNKDLFVPNVFTPNGDGKNDLLFAYGSNIKTLEMRIFNQWGQQIEVITDPAKGWDGRYKGQPQPVGVYVYTLRAEMLDGRMINLKGNITLLR